MFGNYIEYSVVAEKFVITLPIEITSKDSCINTIFLSQKIDDHKKTSIRFMLTDNINSYYEAETVTQVPLAEILNIIAVTIGGYIGIPELSSYKISGIVNTHADMPCAMTVTTSQSIIDEFTSNLNSSKRYTDGNYSLFRMALQNKDSISRYIFFYSILGIIIGNQDKIDDYIKIKEPSVKYEASTNPRRQGHMETIYTYYRNQVSHTTTRSDLLKIRSEIENILSRFTEHVKEAILENT